MCQKAAQTAAAVMAGIRPTLVSLLTATGVASTPDGLAAIAAFDAAEKALQGWQTGTPAQNVIQLIGDFETIFATLPLPANVITFTNLILAGIATVIGIVTANSPAPAAPADATAHPLQTQAIYQANVAAETTAKVQALVPKFKPSIFHTPESQYEKAWNAAVDANPGLGLVKL